MKNRFVQIFIGLCMLVLAIMAYYSNEPASVTTNGRIVTFLVGIFGTSMVLSNLFVSKNPLICPNCQKKIKEDYIVCPYCNAKLKGE